MGTCGDQAQGRLPGAVGSEQSHHGALSNAKKCIMHDFGRAVAGTDPCQVQHHVRAGRGSDLGGPVPRAWAAVDYNPRTRLTRRWPVRLAG